MNWPLTRPTRHGAERAIPRDVADHQRRRRADDAQDVGIVFAIRAEQNGLDLDFVVPAFGEQRTNRTIRQAAREDFLFRRTAFAFEVTAGEFAGGCRVLAVIDREREKVLAGLGLGSRDGGDDDDGFSELDCDGAVSLLGEFAGFDVYFFATDSGGDLVRHLFLL